SQPAQTAAARSGQPAGQQGQAGGNRPTLAQLVRQVSTRSTDLIAQYDAEAANGIQRLRVTRPDKPTVVIVGEAKRGKSSLLNALINVPGLSPVDTRVAT